MSPFFHSKFGTHRDRNFSLPEIIPSAWSPRCAISDCSQ
ncbi:Hypothetical protein BSSP2_I0813 [Brucella suis bv. 2]|nr:hypothetical protein BM28_A0813 [Brucella melitensis M28]AIB17536.1 Hypothetical protein BSSP3_I0811 [Brucella suis bv. 2]AIB24366.1 Hypothetical protein BSPT2_I0902 [Brucella suis bv. 2]AIB31038.1 Hypothetical protein BSSP2_I0813 [Brucella suis bv. 2]